MLYYPCKVSMHGKSIYIYEHISFFRFFFLQNFIVKIKLMMQIRCGSSITVHLWNTNLTPFLTRVLLRNVTFMRHQIPLRGGIYLPLDFISVSFQFCSSKCEMCNVLEWGRRVSYILFLHV